VAIYRAKNKDADLVTVLGNPSGDQGQLNYSSNDDYEKYVGDYECYHFSTADKPVIVRSSVEIKKNSENNLKVVFDAHKYNYRNGHEITSRFT